MVIDLGGSAPLQVTKLHTTSRRARRAEETPTHRGLLLPSAACQEPRAALAASRARPARGSGAATATTTPRDGGGGPALTATEARTQPALRLRGWAWGRQGRAGRRGGKGRRGRGAGRVGQGRAAAPAAGPAPPAPLTAPAPRGGREPYLGSGAAARGSRRALWERTRPRAAAPSRVQPRRCGAGPPSGGSGCSLRGLQALPARPPRGSR